ncbi:MAG: hypothetical protein QM536_08765 [Chitinophagaceae bacterium]|nr:hypothetical protein [Chitinophagaceae bacterium]
MKTKNKSHYLKQQKQEIQTQTQSISKTYPLKILSHHYTIIIGVGFLLYMQTLWFDFTGLDDRGTLVDNQKYFQDVWNIFRAFIESYGDSFYRPLLFGSLVFDFQFSGTSPFFYHFTNIIHHIIVCCLVYTLFLLFRYEKKLCFLLSLVFAVHPLFSSAVGWIYGRNDTLLAIHGLLSIIFFIKYNETRRYVFLVLHFVFWCVALYTKETAVCVSVLCLVYFFMFTSDEKTKLFPNVLVLFVGWVIIGVFWVYIRSVALENNVLQGLGKFTKLEMVTKIESVKSSFPFILESFSKLFLPIRLSVYPSFSKLHTLFGSFLYILIGYIFFFYNNKKNTAMLSFGIVWWFLFLIPPVLISFGNEKYDYLEHRIYFPAVGMFICIAEVLKSYSLLRIQIFIFVIGGIFVVQNFQHTKNFKNSINFWENALSSSPQKIEPHRIWAEYYRDNKKYGKALEHVNTIIKIDPINLFAMDYLSLYYFKTKQYERSKYYIVQLMKYQTQEDANTYSNYAYIMEAENKIDSAQIYFQKSLALNPKQWKVIRKMAYNFFQRQAYDSAEMYYQKVILLEPNALESFAKLGDIALLKKDLVAAERYWTHIIEQAPNTSEIYKKLLLLYTSQNKTNEIKNLIERAKNIK